jgi:hypothetical protein
MNAVESTADLTGSDSLTIPTQIANQLPKAGKARVILFVEDQMTIRNRTRVDTSSS